jgi:hypothetical protein
MSRENNIAPRSGIDSGIPRLEVEVAAIEWAIFADGDLDLVSYADSMTAAIHGGILSC